MHKTKYAHWQNNNRYIIQNAHTGEIATDTQYKIYTLVSGETATDT